MHESLPHRDAITEIILLTDGNMVLSSLDGTVSICDEFCTFMYRITRKNPVGITRMCLLSLGDDGTKFVATCGYEPAPTMWLLQNSDSSPPFALRDSVQQHNAPVIDVVSVHEHSMPHVVSLDVQGLIKVWNAKNWQCSQTIKSDQIPGINPQGRRWISLCYDVDNRRLSAFALGQIVFFNYGAPTVMENVTADDKPITAFCYDRLRNVIITASEKTLRAWDALTGKLSLLQLNAAPSTISAVAVSDTGRRMYIGTVCGRVTCNNASSAMLIRTLSSAGSEVHSIHYGLGRSFIIVLRWDSTVQLFYETGGQKGVAVSSLTMDPRCFQPIEAKCIAFSDTLNRIAVGDRKGFITVFEAKVRSNEAFNIIRQFEVPKNGVELTTLIFLTGLPLLLSIDTNSQVVIWTLPPYNQPFEPLATWSSDACITGAAWYWPKALVYFATQGGIVITASLYNLLERNQLTRFCSSIGAMESCKFQGAICEEGGIDIVNMTTAHQEIPINFIACDVISRYVVTVADRSVKMWSSGMQPLGKLDQYQQEMHMIAPNYDATHSAHGDRVCQFRDDEDFPDAPVIEPVEPLPGSGWLRGLHSNPPARLCGWYAAMGISPLSLVGSDHSKFTQNSFRTTQCHEAIARIRDLKILQDVASIEAQQEAERQAAKLALKQQQQVQQHMLGAKGGIKRYSTMPITAKPSTPEGGKRLQPSNHIRCVITPADYEPVDATSIRARQRREKLSTPFQGKRLQRFEKSPPISPNAADYCTGAETKEVSVPMRAQFFAPRGKGRVHVVRKLERLAGMPGANDTLTSSNCIPVGDEVLPAPSLASSPSASPSMARWGTGEEWLPSSSIVENMNSLNSASPSALSLRSGLALDADEAALLSALPTTLSASGTAIPLTGSGTPSPSKTSPPRVPAVPPPVLPAVGDKADANDAGISSPASLPEGKDDVDVPPVAASDAEVGVPAAQEDGKKPGSAKKNAEKEKEKEKDADKETKRPPSGSATRRGSAPRRSSSLGRRPMSASFAERPPSGGRITPLQRRLSQDRAGGDSDDRRLPRAGSASSQRRVRPQSAAKAAAKPPSAVEDAAPAPVVTEKDKRDKDKEKATTADAPSAPANSTEPGEPERQLAIMGLLSNVDSSNLRKKKSMHRAPKSALKTPAPTEPPTSEEPAEENAGESPPPRPSANGKKVVVCEPEADAATSIPRSPSEEAACSPLDQMQDYMPPDMLQTFQFLQKKGSKNLFMTIFSPEDDREGVPGQPDKRGKDDEALERDLFQGTGYLPRELKVQLADQWRQKVDEKVKSPPASPLASPATGLVKPRVVCGNVGHKKPFDLSGDDPLLAQIELQQRFVATPVPRSGSRLAACLRDWHVQDGSATFRSTMEQVYSPLQCLQKGGDAEFDAMVTSLRASSRGRSTPDGPTRSGTPASGMLRRRGSLKGLAATQPPAATPAGRNYALLGIRNIRVAAGPMEASNAVLAEIRQREAPGLCSR
eukprot:TRINITY_DN16601_c0_g1_i1.p1 TRINITY_DN16601_c0_g1~~TRINITY_DN16601_c0_g1_i1.p1  ORF type:complete len:1622 (+),score=509.10 TRINITY_DN16601_c0_g1_i1:417-4868(+)